MAGLLNTLKKNWRGLLDEVQAAPESLRALTQPAAAQQFDAALRKGGTIDKEKAVQMAMDVLQTTPMGVMGKIVYHGSPHKFDKFDMSRIGTGEGVQAYGHGLYMAESPGVAKWYGERLPDLAAKKVFIDGVETNFPQYDKGLIEYIDKPNFPKDELYGAFETSIDDARRFGREQDANSLNEILASIKKSKEIIVDHGGALYKVDIPDEAIPRMLDWDKPLSEQAPEVQAAILATRNRLPPNAIDDMGGDLATLYDMSQSPGDFLGTMASLGGRQDFGEMMLKELNVPGIRYLDGGSRAAGGGTSNFVLFDDQLPRILERNGIPTGLNPWAPGEWRGLLEP